MSANKRSDNELNRIIAEWMGWRFIPEHDAAFTTPAGSVYPESWHDPDGNEAMDIPSYCTDLNAIREAVYKLPKPTQYMWFCNQLMQICGTHIDSVNATARQRAEALVNVISALPAS